MGGHARFSPSSGKRRLECPPSLLLEEQFPDEESPFAAEGSAGHALAEYLINKYLKKRTKRPVSDYYSDELLEAVDDYVEYNITQIEQARKDCDQPFIGVELKVSLAHRIEGCFGTADMVVVDSHKIHIIDLKLGKGVVVDAEQNVQLMIYGLGVLDMLGFLYEIDTVELTIVQPRIEHFSTWEISAGELLAWGKDVLEPRAAKALSGEGEFKAGDHCRFCKARFTCRARAEEYLKLAQMEFAEPALMSDEEIAEVLSKADALKKWAEEVYTYAQNEAVVNHKEWPGYKLVLGRSNRKYTDEDEVAEAAQKAGYTDIYKKSLIGITEMERLMGKKKFNEILGSLELLAWGKDVLEPRAAKALSGEGEFKAGDHCRFCKARFTCRARAEEYLKLAQMEFAEPALMSDEEIAEVLSKADALKKWAEEVYTYAQNEAVVNHKEWPGYKLVLGRSNRKYTDEDEVAEAAQKAGYTDIYKKSLIGITEMERLMGKKKFNEILGSLVYKPDGKVTLVPDSDKREAVKTATAEADFKED